MIYGKIASALIIYTSDGTAKMIASETFISLIWNATKSNYEVS